MYLSLHYHIMSYDNLILKDMKLTRKQKIKFVKEQDFTGILQFCSDKECLQSYPNIVRFYRETIREKEDGIITTLNIRYSVLRSRLVSRYGRGKGCLLWRKVKQYVLDKRNKF